MPPSRRGTVMTGGFLAGQNRRFLARARTFTRKARGDFGAWGEASVIYPPVCFEHPEQMFFGDHVMIREHAWFGAVVEYGGRLYAPRLDVGDHTTFGHGCHLFCCAHMRVGRSVMIADHVYISDNLHGYEDVDAPPSLQPLNVPGPVSIGDASWVGEHACIMPNVAIGRHCVIGANSVVTRDVPDYCVVVGAPAHIVRRYDAEKRVWARTEGAR